MANFQIYQPFQDGDIVNGFVDQVNSGLWADGNVYYSQSLFVTSSTQAQITGSNGALDVLNGLYYLNVYDTSPLNFGQSYFSVSYGDFYGGGSSTTDTVFPTEAIYTQFSNTLLGNTSATGLFSFQQGTSGTYVTSSQIFVMNFASDKMKDQIAPGQWQVSLNINGITYTFIDESPLLSSAEQSQVQSVYEIISGSFNNAGIAVPYNGGVYNAIGLFYPKNGVIIFNAIALNQQYNYSYVQGDLSYYPLNHFGFFNALQTSNDACPMRVMTSEFIPSNYYFIRAKNQYFNYSNNPTFAYQSTSGSYSRGNVIQTLANNPTTYVTTVGLYDATNTLVAVGKFSIPLKKNFSSEITVRCRLSF